ncbi:hypothetical protein AUEXF2481DRAFT_37376 [Aureobasidium subglaciale EXF-2481]|uniref:Secreted protein n=1 Tax=Aureobasidium subglaciale (strain EXF-2481) TaxID=1043005 RepID=A0A074YJF7_AURSE|nr:uncharacterized protein AUEXF2481DRAFT_37376 [Aureobasidium subglaciale EXF-2481]KEQ97830.1 hypothetical protein AUEXF2481DRAFT_37376 [Aureobasidium subglaciale EXF-2481]
MTFVWTLQILISNLLVLRLSNRLSYSRISSQICWTQRINCPIIAGMSAHAPETSYVRSLSTIIPRRCFVDIFSQYRFQLHLPVPDHF